MSPEVCRLFRLIDIRITRASEVTSIRMDAFGQNVEAGHHRVTLIFRKTNQLNGAAHRSYLIGHDARDPDSVNAFEALNLWLGQYASIINRPFRPDDFLFPAWSKAGLLEPSRAASTQTLGNVLSRVTSAAPGINRRHPSDASLPTGSEGAGPSSASKAHRCAGRCPRSSGGEDGLRQNT